MHAVVCCSLVVCHLKFHNTVRGIIWYDLVWVYALVSYSFMMFDRRSTPLVWGSYSWAYWECIERESANVTWCGTGRGTRTHTWDWFSSAFSALARPKRGQRPTSALRRKRLREWERERENHTRPIHPHTYTAYTDFFISVVMRIEIHQNLQAENSLRLVQDGRGVALHCQTLRKMLDFCSGFICVMVWAHVRWISQSPFSMTLWYSMPELHVENRWHVGDMSR